MPVALLIYVLVLPLAAFVGYMLATPADFTSFAFVGMVFGALSIPILLKAHHLLLVFTWNASLIVFFLPGQPQLGMVMAFVSLIIAIITRTMSKKRQFLQVPSVTLPLLLILMVVIVTAKFTGGIGGRVFGAETWGAKRYLGVFGAVAGYFAFTAQPVPLEKARKYFAAFFFGGMTAVISDLIFMAGPAFYFLFVLFPSDSAAVQAMTADTLRRLSGVSYACIWASHYMFGRFGLEGIFNLRYPWRLGFFTLLTVGSFLGGYRGTVILLMLVFTFQFFIEGIHRTKLGPILVCATLLTLGGTILMVDRMPIAVQRSMSFLPLPNIDSAARLDAMATLDWRLSMWKLLIPEVPKYLFLGKGYAFNGTDYYLTQEAMRRGMYASYEDTLISGNYHNGILTLLIPFGIFGLLAFLWFAGAALVVLVKNHRYGDPNLAKINTFLLTFFCARLTYYIIFYGQFDLDLPQFTGFLGLSIALNGGVRSRVVVTEPVPIPMDAVPVPA